MTGFRFVVDVILILGGVVILFLMLPKRIKKDPQKITFATYEIDRVTHRHGIPDEDDQDLETIKRKMHNVETRGE